MEAGIVEQVEQWESEPFSGGYGALRDLADREFTGAVVTGDTYLFMLNGRAIGVFDLPPAGSPTGAIEVFENATGTAYEAPHLSLPLLFTMYLSDGETRAQYYTEDTPIEEVDEQLSEGGFTGYIELSENVLSGDYYVVYQAGRSMSAAFVGASNRLYTDEEAFERANDEVGIYDVVSVDIDVLEIPEPDTDESAAAAAGGQTAETEPESESEPESAPETSVYDPDATPESDDDPADTPAEETATGVTEDTPAEPEPAETAATDADADADRHETSVEPASEPASDSEEHTSEATPGAVEPDEETTPERDAYDPQEEIETEPTTVDEPPSPAETSDAVETAPEAAPRSDEGALTVRSVPALDPEQSSDGGTVSKTRQSGIDARDRRSRTQSEPERTTESERTTRVSEEVQSLQSTLAERDERIEELEMALAEADDEREELRAERDRLREERDELEATIEELRQRLDELEAASQDSTVTESSGGNSLTPQEALAGTDLFVRYRSKSDPTLAAVADGAEKSAVTSNLRLERHTRFDDADATVQGQRFGAFLEKTLAYQFVQWAVEDLLYEIRDTGHTAALRDLYDALPDVDRAELQGTVTIETEDGDGTEERSFDVVLRDRMGDPLVVANLDTSRQPTGGEPMRSLIEDATVVANGSDGLSAAFFVTSSFFESDALETARNETGTGLLSRDKRKSVVKLSRKRGYHLCLVEARDESFHLTVPEL